MSPEGRYSFGREDSDPPAGLKKGRGGVRRTLPSVDEFIKKAAKRAAWIAAILAMVKASIGIATSLSPVVAWVTTRPSRSELQTAVGGEAAALAEASKRITQQNEDAEKLRQRLAEDEDSLRSLSRELRDMYQSGISNHVWGPTNPAPPSIAPRGPK